MDPSKTLIVIVLDRSGSMDTIKAAAERGFNAFIEAQRAVPGVCLVTLVQFDTEYEIAYKNRAITSVPDLILVPRGGTALLDAMGRTIMEVGASLAAMREKYRPGKVIVLVVTDGGENASTRYRAHTVADLIAHQRSVYNWQFVFLGVDESAITEARALGFDASSVLRYNPDSEGTHAAYTLSSQAVTSYRTGTTSLVTFNSSTQQEVK